MRYILAAAVASLSLAACGPVTNDDPTRAIAGQAPVAGPAPVGAPATSARVLDGVARFNGVPLGGAEVIVRDMASGAALVSTTAKADGTFRVVLPEALKPGTVVMLVAKGQGHRVVNLGQVPEERVLLQAGVVLVLDTAQTAAVMILAPRILAALQLGSELAIANAMESLNQAAIALGSESTSLIDAATFDAAVNAVLDAAERVLQTPEARQAVADVIPPEVVEQIVAQAEVLADIIRDEVVNEGRERPSDELTGPLAIGDQTVPPVFEDDTQEPGQATNPGPGPDPIIPNDPDVTIDLTASTPAEGVFGDPGASITGEAQ